MQILTTQNVQYLDTQNRSCSNGYIYVLDVKNLTELDVYTLTDSQYVKAANPIRLDLNGRPNQTYFTEALAYCRLYDVHDQFVREWYGSSNVDPVINDTIVYTVANLRKAALTLGSVTVVGYLTEHDCEARTYTWQAECNTSDDAGLVIKSDLSESGRWLLVTDRAYIPSTYYGVYPGHEENIQKFLARANTVYDQSYPTCNFFVSGKYETAAGLATLHPVLLDRGVSFAANYFSAPSFKLVGKQTSDAVIGNLKTRAAVRSSWYATYDDMFDSGSLDMTIDAAKRLTSDHEMKNVYLHGKSINTYVWGGLLTLNDCYIDDDVFSGLETLKFLNMDFSDRYFYAKNTFALTAIQASSVASLHTFKSPDMYVKALEEYTTDTTYRLDSRPLKAAHTLANATEIHAANTSAAIVVSKSCTIYDSDIVSLNTSANLSSEITVTLINSRVKNLGANSYTKYVLIDSTVENVLQSVYISSITASCSTILAGQIDTAYTKIDATDTTVKADLTYSTVASGVYVKASNCVFADAILTHADLSNCTLDTVTVWPYSINSTRHMDLHIVNCSIDTLQFDETWQQNTLQLDLTGTSINQHTYPSAGTSANPYFTSATVVNGSRVKGIVLKKSDFTLDGDTATSKAFEVISNYVTPALTRRIDIVATSFISKLDYSVTYDTHSTVNFATDTVWTVTISISKDIYDNLLEMTLV